MIRIASALAVIAGLAAAPVAPASAQERYPSRQVRIIVPFPAGGPIDVIARLVGQKLSPALGQVIIETGLVAPAKTPPAIVARLNQEVNAGLKSADMIAALGKLGSSPLGGTPQDFHKLLVEEGAKWLAVVKSSGMKIE